MTSAETQSPCGRCDAPRTTSVPRIIRCMTCRVVPGGMPTKWRDCTSPNKRVEQRSGLKLALRQKRNRFVDPDFHKHDSLITEVIDRMAGDGHPFAEPGDSES